MQASAPFTITLSTEKANLRRVHGEHVRITCPHCRGGANLAAVNGGLADYDGFWFCDDCTAGGRYDRLARTPRAARFQLRLRDVLAGVH